MKQHSSGFIIGIVASIILGFGIVAGIWLGLSSISGLGSESGVVQATRTGPNSATLELATYPDSHVCHPDAPAEQAIWVTYCSGANGLATRLEVPPNSVITVVLKQYDSGTTLINDYFGQVRGTSQMSNGQPMAMLDGKPFSNISDVSAISKNTPGHTFSSDPGHTFTIQSAPNTPPDEAIFVSVPLIGVNSNAPANVNINGNMYPTPNVISFQFRTGPAGITYLWHCYDPCGDTQYARKPPFGFSGPMWTLGYMAGTVSVTNY
jgi:hypothetical protein